MKQIPIWPGADVSIATLAIHDGTGSLATPDATPTVVLYVDDSGDPLTDTGVTVTVVDFGALMASPQIGLYKALLDVDTFMAHGDSPEAYSVWGFWLWTIDGVQQAAPIDPFILVPQFTAGYAVTGTNNATTFKVSTGAGYTAAWGVDDGLVDMLLTFTTGALLGQCRRVTAYNAATGYLTVDTALTGTPANGDRFWLSNF